MLNNNEIVATINAREENWFSGLRSLYLGKFAVWPKLKRQGLGMILLNYAEKIARSEAYQSVQLDTAKPAIHLVELYQRLGYKNIGETHFEGKTYDSWIFEKQISELPF